MRPLSGPAYDKVSAVMTMRPEQLCNRRQAKLPRRLACVRGHLQNTAAVPPFPKAPSQEIMVISAAHSALYSGFSRSTAVGRSHTTRIEQ